MFRKVIFYDNYTNAITETWWSFVAQGILLVLLGILIFLVPELLAAMASGVFIAIGALSVVIGLKTKNLKRRYSNWRESFWDPL